MKKDIMPAGDFIYKILIIDDDPDFVASTKTVLESRTEYRVLIAGDGVSGLLLAKNERPDLIILDVIMPFKDGFTAAAEIRSDPELSQIPIIILTNFSRKRGETDISVAQGMELEAEDYVEKPVSPQELLRKVDRIIHNR